MNGIRGIKLSKEEKNVFTLEKPIDLEELVDQIESISNEIEKETNKLFFSVQTVRNFPDIINENQANEMFYNLSQNIIELSELIQKKVKGE